VLIAVFSIQPPDSETELDNEKLGKLAGDGGAIVLNVGSALFLVLSLPRLKLAMIKHKALIEEKKQERQLLGGAGAEIAGLRIGGQE
jgi:hypothetical protein